MRRPAALLLLAALAPLAGAPAADSQGPWWVAGSDAYFYTTHAHAGTLVDHLRAARMNTFFADAKDERGDAGWTTDAAPNAFEWDPGDGPVERAVQAAREGGARIAVAARYSTFQDQDQAEGALSAARIGDTWWLDPACAGVVEHVEAQVLDLLARTRVDEVNLDFVRYPAWGDVGVDVELPCTGGHLLDEDPSRYDHVAAAVGRIAATVRAAHPDVAVSADVFGYTCHGPMVDIGQDAARLAPLVDWLMPMLYPSYFAPPGGLFPYDTVKAATEACVARLGDADKVKPWIQGFDHPPYPYSLPPFVQDQLDGAKDGGATGVAIWWMETYGTFPVVGPALPEVYWEPLAAAMPTDWQHRPYRAS